MAINPLFSELFLFIQECEPKISRRTIKAEVQRLTEIEFRHVKTNLDTKVCRGMYLSAQNVESRLVQQVGHTVICTARDLNYCWERIVFTKELMHVFSDLRQKVDEGEKLDVLLNELSYPSRDPSDPMLDEIHAFWMAISVLCPQRSRISYQNQLFNDEIDIMGIANDLKIPENYVPRLFDKRYDDFLKKTGLIDLLT